MRQNVIKQLSEIEHVLKRPGMYLGDVDVGKHLKWIYDEDQIIKKEVKICPAALKMFDEVVSNSIDEALRTNFKRANRIDINVSEDTITVSDNGRGISSEKLKGSDKPQSVAAFTNLRAGSNFDETKEISIGTHGLGASLVNIMSKKFTVSTSHNKLLSVITCSDNMSNIDFDVQKKNMKSFQGTTVSFTPDFKRLGMTHFDEAHIKLIHKRVLDLSVAYPEIRFRWNNRVVPARHFKTYCEMFKRPYEIIQCENYRFAVMATDEPAQISFVNGIDTYEGGTHVDYMSNQVINRVRESIYKKYKKFKIKPSDIRNHMMFVLITNKIKSPKFRSQTKEYITNAGKEYKGILDIKSDHFFNKIIANEDLIDPIIETYRLKQEAKERVEVKAAQRKLGKKKVLSHIPAGHKDPEIRQLFISEGQSALGSLSNVRDSKLHGGYPLRGKPMNITGQSLKKILANKELSDLMKIIGLELGSDYEKLNYGTINILADADYDGYSIVGLLLNFFSMWPRLFEEKRINIISSPILKTEFKKERVYYYTLADYNKAVKNGKVRGEITYLKGLGSLTDEAYESMIHNPVKHCVNEITTKDKNMIEVVYGNDAHPRKEWMMC